MSGRSFTRRSSFLAILLALWVAAPAAAKRADVHGLPLPPGTKSLGDGLFESGRGFRKTVEFYQRLLKRRGLAHEAVPIYGAHGTVVARFLAKEPGSHWSALHVFKIEGRTRIFIVPATPLTQPAQRGKESDSQK